MAYFFVHRILLSITNNVSLWTFEPAKGAFLQLSHKLSQTGSHHQLFVDHQSKESHFGGPIC